MEQTIPPLLLHAVTWATIIGGIGYLFEQAEKVVSSATKAAVSRWLLNLDPAGAVTGWPATFATMFDRVFDERHLSWRCFSRSCIASLVSVVVVTFLWGALRPSQFTSFFTMYIRSDDIGWKTIAVFLITAIFNLIPDYLSLIETRYIIQHINRTHSTIHILAFLTIDFMATATIGFGAIVGGLILITKGNIPVTELISTFIEYALPLSVWETGSMSLGIWFYAAFFTSVWVWLYVLSGSVVRLLEYLGVGINRLKFVLDVENKPLRSIGFISIVLFTIVYFVLFLIW